MALVKSFEGVRFNPEKVDLRKVVCPPYDIISPEGQQEFHNQNPHNIIRIELGLDRPGDDEKTNRYSRAADFFKEWLTGKILRAEPSPSLYLYHMQYEHPQGGTQTLKGFIAAVGLEPFGSGKIFPHEWTFPKAKTDRLNLLRACRANTSPIFSLFSDPENSCLARLETSVAGRKPDMEVDQNGVIHRVWVTSDQKALGNTEMFLADRPLFIADGHHRYETALNYQAERRAADSKGGEKPYDRVMMFCANMDDPGLSLLPIHRIVLNPMPVQVPALLDRLQEDFDLRPIEGPTGAQALKNRVLEEIRDEGRKGTVFGLVAGKPAKGYLLKKKEKGTAPSARAVDQLDVAHFQRLVLGKSLGIQDSAEKKERLVEFIKDEDAAIRKLEGGEAGALFFLNATRIQQVRDVVLAGNRMPQKSTYFYPKPLTGLVLNRV